MFYFYPKLIYSGGQRKKIPFHLRLGYGSTRNQQSSTKSSKENTVNRSVGIIGHVSSSVGGGVGIPSSIDRGPGSEGRGLVTDRVGKVTGRNVKSPSRNKSNPSNKTSNRLAEKNEKNRQQIRHQIEKEPEDKDVQNSTAINISDIAALQKQATQKATITVEELREQQRVLAEQALIIQKVIDGFPYNSCFLAVVILIAHCRLSFIVV